MQSHNYFPILLMRSASRDCTFGRWDFERCNSNAFERSRVIAVLVPPEIENGPDRSVSKKSVRQTRHQAAGSRDLSTAEKVVFLPFRATRGCSLRPEPRKRKRDSSLGSEWQKRAVDCVAPRKYIAQTNLFRSSPPLPCGYSPWSDPTHPLYP